jgi:NhaP-type Na+/H+ or K+/H+ antiporter
MAESETISGIEIMFGFMKFLSVSVGGCIIGITCGLMTSLVTKFTENVRGIYSTKSLPQ